VKVNSQILSAETKFSIKNLYTKIDLNK